MEDQEKKKGLNDKPAEQPSNRPAPPRPGLIGPQIPSISTRAASKAPETEAPAVSGRELIKHPPIPSVRQNWGLELPLVPSSLIPAEYNRFAHTAAVTVVDDPGMICNPLLVFGEPGAGKTHFINYIAYALTTRVGAGAVLLTDGAKLSRAIGKALSEGTMDSLAAFIGGMKALVIDDLHRLEVSPANGPHIAGVVNGFLDGKKQVILASGLAPGHLAALEEALGANFTRGWTVDLKNPTPAQLKGILARRAKELGFAISEEQLAELSSGSLRLGEAAKALEKLRKNKT